MFDHTILLAHGSRDPRWGEPFQALEARLRKDGQAVSLAFMELAEPDLDQVVTRLVARESCRSIAVLPLFLASGRHLREDVPAQIQDLELRLGIQLSLLEPVGAHPAFADFLAGLVEGLLRSPQAAGGTVS